MSTALRYQVQPNEPSIQVELYLPKKAALQGVLYETLTDGFRRDGVRTYFADLSKPENAERKAQVRALSNPCWTVLQEDLTDEEISAFPRLYYGYSMYEVEGVYLRKRDVESDASEVEDSDENYELVEELTQVIRIVFKYESADRPQTTIGYLKAAMRDPLSGIGTIDQNYADQEWMRTIPSEAREELGPLYAWIRYVGWFLFGFLLHRICVRIVELHASSARDLRGSVKQEEIWLTSLWSLNLNVVRAQLRKS